MDGLVGRGDDLAVLEGFLDRGPLPGARALVLEGPPGIGKTTLWTAGIERARRRGFEVLVTRPARADAELGFLALADLLHEANPDLLQSLPDHQRLALSAALEGGNAAPGARALYPAVLSVLSGMVLDSGLVIAIDDLQWLDADSAGALSFALRRLQDRELRLLVTRTSIAGMTSTDQLELVIDSERLDVTALDLDHMVRLVHDQLGLTLSNLQWRRLHEITGGNPLFVREFARVLASLEGPADLDQIPLPDRVESLLEERIRGLTQGAHRALLTIALAGESPIREVVSIVGLDALDDAVDAGALRIEHDRVRLAHPLLGEVARQRAGMRELRNVHRAISCATDDPANQALHLALATNGPDEEAARLVSSASSHTAQRGSNVTAAVLADHALRLTITGSQPYAERLLAAAVLHQRRGELGRVVELLAPQLEQLESPEHRAVARYLLVECDDSIPDEQAQEIRERALAELGDRSPGLRSRLLAAISMHQSVTNVSSIPEAEKRAVQAQTAALCTENLVAAEEAFAALCWARAMRGANLSELLATRAAAEPPPQVLIYDGVDRIEAVNRLWRGESESARARILVLRELAEQRAEEESYLALRLHCCELDLRCGRWADAELVIDEWARELPLMDYATSYLTRCRALLAAGRGNAELARSLALEALATVGRGSRWNALEALRALGLSQLLLGEPEQAAGSLQRVWEQTHEAGVGNLGTFPVGADLAEALALSGRGAEAGTVAQALGVAATAQDHPWAAAAAERAWGHVLLASGEVEQAALRLQRAASLFGDMDLQLDRCRSLTALGAAQRRARHLREARQTLDTAIDMLEALGSAGWAEPARLELARVGGRKSNDALTAAEQQVAQLVQEGLANKLISQRLVISTSTVEAHLTRIYRKLGVSSRTELARLMAEQSVGISPIPSDEFRT